MKAIAKAEGKYKGRKEVSISDFETYYQRYMNREVSKSQLAKELGISRPTTRQVNQRASDRKLRDS